MKKIFNIAIVLLAALGITRCGKFLDVEPYIKDMIQYDSVFVKEKTTKEWLWNVYASLGGINNEITWADNGAFCFASDEAIFSDDVNTCEKYQNGQYSAVNQYKDDRYSALYIGIRTASVFIHNVHKCYEVTSTERSRMQGEARFLRAYFYFMLMKQYGPVPLVPDEGQDVSLDYAALALPRASLDEVVEFIVSDLEQAARVLPTDYSSTWIGRATQGAALALRAKTLLYAASPLFNGNTALFSVKDNEGRPLISQQYDEEKWARAAAAAKEVIDLGLYALNTAPRTDKTIPLADNVPTDRFPNGAGGIDPYESYAQTFNGEQPITHNLELIFYRQTATVEPIVYRAFPYSHKGVNNIGITLKQVDAYYMRDGHDKDNSSSKFPYYTTGFTTNDEPDAFAPIGTHRMYANREPRFYASISYNGCIWENATADDNLKNVKVNYFRAGTDGKQLSRPYNFPLTGIGLKKYYHPDDSYDIGGRRNYKVAPDIRYADVLLWYAEAMNELTSGKSYEFRSVIYDEPFTVTRNVDEMRKSFKQVRFRAGLPDLEASEYNSPDTFRAKLKRERQIELFLEGARYFDLRRWLDAETEENMPIQGMNIDMKGSGMQKERFFAATPVQMSKVFMSKMYLWPFPAEELKRNTKLTQNPGW